MGMTGRIDRARVLQLAERGLSCSQIAARMGCTTSHVARIIRAERGKGGEQR